MAAPPTLCCTQCGEAAGTSPRGSVSSETLRCLGTRRARAVRDTLQDGGSPWCLPGWQQGLLSQPTLAHWRGKPSMGSQVGWETPPKALQPSKHGTIQHRIILKVKIVYCCLCRNALTSPVLFLYLAVGLQA